MSDKYSEFKCEVCDGGFKLLGNLIKHNEIVHNHNFHQFKDTITAEMSPYKCIYCEHTVEENLQLTNHTMNLQGIDTSSQHFCGKYC